MLFRHSPILLVDDDARFRRAFVDYFRSHGLAVLEADSAESAMALMESRQVTMVVADWKESVIDGAVFITRLRALHPMMPLVMQSARADIESQLNAYSSGADDYWVKPFPLSLAVAKSQALLRRSIMRTTSGEPLRLGETIVDLRTRTVVRDGITTALKEKEFGILRHLALQDGAPIQREHLLGLVWGYETMPVTRTIDNYIVSLRRKIEQDPANPRYLLTIPGVGYRLNRDDAP